MRTRLGSWAGINVFAYSQWNPLAHFDPYGLEPPSPENQEEFDDGASLRQKPNAQDQAKGAIKCNKAMKRCARERDEDIEFGHCGKHGRDCLAGTPFSLDGCSVDPSPDDNPPPTDEELDRDALIEWEHR